MISAKTCVATAIALMIGVPTAAGQSKPQPGAQKKPATEAKLPSRVVLPDFLVSGDIKKVDPDGTVWLAAATSEPFGGPIAKVAIPPGDGLVFKYGHVLRVTILDGMKAGTVKLRVGVGAVDKVVEGEHMGIFRPAQLTAAHYAKIPDVVPAVGRGFMRIDAPEWAAELNESFSMLKAISTAASAFASKHNSLPPVALIGPDGKPWHSWRILLAPYLHVNEQSVYNAYRWDEPWDGPNNRKLHAKMPPFYATPSIGARTERYTNCVAISGKGTAFPSEGMRFDGKKFPQKFEGSDIRKVDAKEGPFLFGWIGSDRKIPWLKPEDIELTDKLPKLGEKGSFGLLPSKTDKGSVSPFGRYMWSGDENNWAQPYWVQGVSGDIDLKLLRSKCLLGPPAEARASVPLAGMTEDDIAKYVYATDEVRENVLYFSERNGRLHAIQMFEP